MPSNRQVVDAMEAALRRLMGEDEYLEITPISVRLRKQNLTENDRTKARR